MDKEMSRSMKGDRSAEILHPERVRRRLLGQDHVEPRGSSVL